MKIQKQFLYEHMRCTLINIEKEKSVLKQGQHSPTELKQLCSTKNVTLQKDDYDNVTHAIIQKHYISSCADPLPILSGLSSINLLSVVIHSVALTLSLDNVISSTVINTMPSVQT